MKLIVGLGNPGEQYKNTRHNLGFEVVDHLVKKLGERGKGQGASWEMNKKLKSEICKIEITFNALPLTLILIKPQTFMNNSGEAASLVANFYKIDPSDVIVIQDELDVLLGKIKVRFGGGFGGHHGVESIMNSLGTDKFGRVRLGIGTTAGFLGEHQRKSFNADHFVMEQFSPQETSQVKTMVKHALAAIEVILKDGLEKAQNQFN